MNREELIEKAAKAMQERMTWRSLHWPNMDAIQHSDVAAALASAALAVFEEAHAPTGHVKDLATSAERVKNGADSSHVTPTGDELRREVERVQKAAWAEIHGQDCRRQYSVAEVKRLVYSFDNLLGSLLHRTVQGEGSEPLRLPALIANRTINRAIRDDQVRGWDSTVAIMQAHELIVTAIEFDRSKRFRTVQGEPSDEAVKAACQAYAGELVVGSGDGDDAMRAALLAAAAVQGGEQ